MAKFKIEGVIISVFAADHLPPHFHVGHPDFDFAVEIDTMSLIAGQYNPKAKKAMKWAIANKSKLQSAWDRYHG